MSVRDKAVPIVGLKPGMKGLHVQVIVLDKVETTKVREGHTIHHYLVADSYAAIHLSLWDSLGEAVKIGDILRISGGWCSLHNQFLHLYSSKNGRVVRVGQYTMLFTEHINLSLQKWALEPGAPHNNTQQTQQTQQQQQLANFAGEQVCFEHLNFYCELKTQSYHFCFICVCVCVCLPIP